MEVLLVPAGTIEETTNALKKLGLPLGDGSTAGGPISGTSCSISGPRLKPNDFNCSDSDLTSAPPRND